ncbi:MAG: hypothetical protein WCF95_02755 [bacterium]
MVSNISGNAGLGAMQQMMAAMQKKMKAADTDGKEGLSKTELASIAKGEDKGAAHMASELSNNFDKIDKNGDGQATDEEIKAARPEKPMGPPPGMMLAGLPPPPPSGKTESTSNKTYDKLDTNEDGEVSIQERIAGEDAEKASSGSSNSDLKNNSGVSSYISKLLSNYQGNSSELASSFDLTA